jgi:uncharacterized membrane protein YeaQ/YmgE (transglycosylase-associated protein family)
MSILTWIFLGLISGFIASKLVGGGGGLLADMVLGIVGALVGGAAFSYFGQAGITGFNIWSIFVSVLGAALVLSVFRFFRRRTSSSY